MESNLKPIPSASLEPLENDDFAKGRLFLDGLCPTVEVPGRILEGAWRIGGLCLVATTEDVPFEDGLHFLLLDVKGDVVDHVKLESAYSTGTFKVNSCVGPKLNFRFFGETNWTLTVLPHPRMHLPFFGDPKGAQRAFSFSTRLKLEGRPQPSG